MDYTKNYNLKKPSNEDFYNVEDFNSNVETVDTELKKVNDKADKIEKQQINKIELEEILSSQNILKKIKEVDGAGSGLDADTVDGLNTGYHPSNGFIPKVEHTIDGSIMEVGRTLDFHMAGSTKDFDGRIFVNDTLHPAWHMGNMASAVRIPLSDGTLQTNLNADLLDGKTSTDFSRSGFGNAGEINSMLQSGSDILAIKNSNGNYINGNFMGCNIINAPTAEWYFIKQIVHNDLWVNLQVLSFTDPNARWKENRMINGGWQGWKEMEGMPICNIPRVFQKWFDGQINDKDNILFSYSGGAGIVKYISGNPEIAIIIDGRELTNIEKDRYSGGTLASFPAGSTPYLSSSEELRKTNIDDGGRVSVIDIQFKNSCVIKTLYAGKRRYAGLVMTAN